MASKTKTQRIDDVISIGTRRETVPHARVGRLVAVDPHGVALVDYQGNPSGPLPAVVAVPLDREGLRAAATSRTRRLSYCSMGAIH